MKVLEIDAGNTRLKWRLLEYSDQQVKKIKSDSVLAPGLTGELPESFETQLSELKRVKIKKIRASNVRGDIFKKSLSIFCNNNFSLDVDYAFVSAECAGIKNAYQNFETLGVDRWLAMLAAYRSANSSVCIVDCGSAITVDLIDVDGQHEGGFIVPGLQLMQRSLGEHTANLKYDPQSAINIEPGKNTAVAINHGVLMMALGMLEKIQQHWGIDRSWYLTGGDADILASFINWQYKINPDLVMDGLEIIADDSGDGFKY
jgi:type III pantothenate kinase